MAYPTTEQVKVIAELVAEYGEPDRKHIEWTSEPYGLVWLRWSPTPTTMSNERNLFIKPDGTRLAWNTPVLL